MRTNDQTAWQRADPVIKIAIEPKSKGDLEKMGNGLYKLAQEDPSFHFTRDEETNQTVIEGMGELHLDIIVDRLRREYKARPQIPFNPHSVAAACSCSKRAPMIWGCSVTCSLMLCIYITSVLRDLGR